VNRLHHWYCNREAWKRHVRDELVPAALDGLDLGGDVLEVGPGFGPATEALAPRAERLTALELDSSLAGDLRARLADKAEIVEGSGTAMPFADQSFDAVVCFTMLHHVPSPEEQDRLFAETHRVLRPGGVFAGTDSLGRGLGFALLHVGDDRVLIDPDRLEPRLAGVGFDGAGIRVDSDFFTFRAHRRSH
jgi:ubiquinone/menaquinone biosynthesis C-methylase UbiE